MLIHLHKQATTTPKVRAAIQASDAPASVLAERFGTTDQTVYICGRFSVAGLQISAIALSPATTA